MDCIPTELDVHGADANSTYVTRSGEDQPPLRQRQGVGDSTKSDRRSQRSTPYEIAEMFLRFPSLRDGETKNAVGLDLVRLRADPSTR